MAGLRPLLSLVANEALLEAVLENPLTLVAVVLTAALTVAMALVLIWDIFGGKTQTPHHLHENPHGLLVRPAALAGASVLGGLGLQLFVAPLVNITMHGDAHLSLFHGFTPP